MRRGKIHKAILSAVLGLTIWLPLSVKAQSPFDYDLGISSHDISFTTKDFVAGQPVRIYAVVRNLGKKDMTASVSFYLSDKVIGEPQIVSSRANGFNEEVFVDWEIPEAPFNVAVKLSGSRPLDQNSTNDQAVTAVVAPKPDSDKDGITDANDNCPKDANSDQRDVNQNGVGDVCEPPPPPFPVFSETTSPVLAQPIGEPDTTRPLSPPIKPAKLEKTPVKSPTPEKIEGKISAVEDADSLKTESKEKIDAAESVNIPKPEPSWRPVIEYQYIDWNTYKFSGIVDLSQEIELDYFWDFGDGTQVILKNPVHGYKKPGKYLVILAVTDKDGRQKTANLILEISFLNLGNWQLKLLLGGLGFWALCLLILIRFWDRRGSGEDSDEDKLQTYIDNILGRKETKAVKEFNKKYKDHAN